MAGILWVEVGDLFEYASRLHRPSGIQRLSYEIYLTLYKQYGNTGLVRFVRHDPLRQRFCDVAWVEIEAVFHALVTAPSQASNRRSPAIVQHTPIRQFARRLVLRLPTQLRVPLVEALVAQQAALSAWMRCLSETGRVLRLTTRNRSRPRGVQPRQPGNSFDRLAGRGDVLLVLGSPWSHASYAALVAKWREQRGLRCAVLVYDLIPLLRPEWVDSGLVRMFRAWFDSTLPQCDQVFAISSATAADVEAYLRRRGIRLPTAVLPIPVGSGFHSDTVEVSERSDRLPPPGSYALIVSTIEARKNHVLLFRLWRRLLEELPREQIPTLVFAGRIGWLVDDLLRQIANTDQLDGKLLILEDPSDAELHALYAGCLFTLFPSFYEGWGLPVTESLAFGKPCFIANRTSLPEAGGTLTRGFDPDNLNDAYEKVVQVLQDPDDLARWEARVRREFRPVPWSASVVAILSGLGHSLRPPPDVSGQHRDSGTGLGPIGSDQDYMAKARIGFAQPAEQCARISTSNAQAGSTINDTSLPSPECDHECPRS